MIKSKNARISVVIPVYNEEDALPACLEAIAQQTLSPIEVIVVDNNSSDATAAVAARYPFVTVLHEPRQGVVHARNRGFNAAQGDIIARIDADTMLEPHWLHTLAAIMEDNSIDAVSGSITYHDLPWKQAVSRLELFFRQRIAKGMADEVFLQGANMGIRRSAWLKVRAATCAKAGLHEDFDLAVHMHDAALRVVFDPTLHAHLSLRRFDSNYSSFWWYALQNPRTYSQHGRTSQRHMYPVIFLVLTNYWLIKLIYRLHNVAQPQLAARVNPAAFVD